MSKVMIIAEAGVNHNGKISVAKKLIDVASEAGADYVKFQTFKADTIVSREALKAEYQLTNTQGKSSQYDMLKSLELSNRSHEELIDHAVSCGIQFFSTAFDVDGLEYLNALGFQQFKVPSGEITNYPYLKKLAQLGAPVMLSTGMSNIDEIKQAVQVLTSEGLTIKDIVVLHCNTEYPTPFGDVNLKALNTISSELGVRIGYSDHTLGIEVPVAAVALGATVIEKHFTLDRGLPGPDHRASLEPKELKEMVTAIRNIELAISGNGIKSPSQSESKNILVVRKSLHIAEDINKGEMLHESNLISLRPGDGISPMEWNNVLGKKAAADLKKSHKLKWSDLL
ncbi:MAG: N-acetylneuraminate synthase [Cyclobacteriaceae bacterium]